jgi:hypothetical protein
MRMPLTAMMRTTAAIIRAIACIASVAMLLTFPMIKPHNFADHFRTPEVRRSIVRHTQVAEVENATVRTVERFGIQPSAVPLLFDCKTKYPDISNVELALQALPTRLFLRLKLGASPAGGEDPFI